MAKLTNKQKMFVNEYLVDLNATQAAIRAGYSKNRAREIGYQNYTKLHVRAAIDVKIAERSDRVGINADDVLRSLVEIKEMDVLEILTEAGNLKPISEWSKIWRTTLSGLDISIIGSNDSETILKKIKWPDKLKNIELIGRHVNVQAWKDKSEHEHTGKLSIKELMQSVQK